MKLRESDKRKAELLSYVVSLDSWDGRRIDQPDYDKRHDAYLNLLTVCVSLLLEHVFNFELSFSI